MEIYADYNKEDKKLLGKYISPNSEYSTFKGIPMSLFEKVMRLLPMKIDELNLEVLQLRHIQDLNLI